MMDWEEVMLNEQAIANAKDIERCAAEMLESIQSLCRRVEVMENKEQAIKDVMEVKND